MKTVLQIRGSNATGKTTVVKGFIERNRLFKRSINIRKFGECFYYSDCSNKYIVIGDYEKKNGGCDCLKGAEHVYCFLKEIIEAYEPEILIFEGFIYSTSAKFARVLNKELNKCGYKFKAIFLYRDFNDVIDKISIRNGGAKLNIESLYSSYNSAIKAYINLLKSGINIKRIDVTNYEFEDMKSLISEEINV